jgi:hypothetical protein
MSSIKVINFEMNGKHNLHVNVMNSILLNTKEINIATITEERGESGVALWQTLPFENMSVRFIEYSKNYKTDGWCRTARAMLCIEGEATLEFSDGRTNIISKGMAFHISDKDGLYRTFSKDGVKLILVDGKFLSAKNDTTRNPWRM